MGEAVETRPFRWGFASAGLVILAITAAGGGVGALLEGFGPRGVAREPGFAGSLGVLAPKDWIFLGFVLSALVFLWLARAAVYRFFRTMQTGVMLVSLSLAAIGAGVLIPQIEGFEDPRMRVPSIADIPAEQVEPYLSAPKRVSDDRFDELLPVDHPALLALPREKALALKGYRFQLDLFRYAEGYFLYHLRHLYGLGLPDTALPPGIEEKLEHFGRKYGVEERDNRRKQMRSAFAGQAKSKAIAEFIHEHGGFLRGCFDLATALQLNRAYKSAWFATLLSLLFVGVFCNTFHGRPASWISTQRVGFFVTHLGVMTLLVGGAISKLTTVRGMLPLTLGQPPTDVYYAFSDERDARKLPFHVKLERFGRSDWKTLEVGFPGEDFKSNPPPYTLWPGRTIELDRRGEGADARPRLAIRVLQLYERAKVGLPRFWEAEDPADPGAIGALAELHLDRPGRDDRPGAGTRFLKPGTQRELLREPDLPFRLRADFRGADSDQVGDPPELFPRDPGRLGRLELRLAGQDVEASERAIHVGDSFEGPGGYQLRVVEATGDFRVDAEGRRELQDPRPLAEQFPRNPAIKLSITPPGGGEPELRPVLEAFDPTESHVLEGSRYKDLLVKLVWDRWSSAGPPRYVLQWGQGGPALLGEDGSRSAVVPGTALALPGATVVVAAQFLTHARFEKSIEFLAPGVVGPDFDADFYSRDPAGAELEVTLAPGTPEAARHVVRLASSDQSLANVWSAPDESFWLGFYEEDRNFPFEWRSVLSIWKPDGQGGFAAQDLGSEREREIRVNDYFYCQGYRFFQSDANPKRPNYSGIGVVYDPGIPVVLYGMYTIILGAVLAFLVRPITQALGKRSVAAGTSR